MPESEHASFRVLILGPFEVYRNGRLLEGGAWQRSVQTLLKLLATTQERRRLRDEVIDVLWPEATPQAGASNLRYVLNLLRRNLGGGDPPAILADRSWIALSPACEWQIDLSRFESLVQSTQVTVDGAEELARLYRGEPLPEDRYADWAVSLRTHIQRLWVDACRRLTNRYRERGEPEEALRWTERAIENDPLDEESVRQALVLLDDLGHRSEALRRFEELEGRLREELDAVPAAETLAVVERIKGSDGPRPEPTPAPTLDVVSTQQLSPGGYLGSLPSGRLVGRNEERSALLAAVEAAAGRGGRLVLLAGEPGVGKTRLAQEATQAAYDRGFLMAAGRCYEPEQNVPYYPFLDALTTAWRVASHSLRHEAAVRWPYLERLLPDVPELRRAGSASLESTGVAARGEDEQRLIRSAAGFLQALAAVAPLALLLDDLHWADSASLDLLLHLARHTHDSRVFLLATYRDHEVGRHHPLHRALVDLSREDLVERLAVRSLAEADTAALVAETLGEREVPPQVAAMVHRLTEGNAFFVQQVVHSLVEQGDLYLENGRWQGKEPGEIVVPQTVRAVIGQRLSHLQERTQELLSEASVLGQTFHFDDLRRMGDRPEEAVEAALGEAIRAGLVRETGRDTYSFSHALTQQAIYGDLSGWRQRRLHRAAGEALEKLPDHERERRVSELALHFRHGEHPERACRYALAAGDGAGAVFAYEEARRQYGLAAELARELADPPQEAVARERLGHTLLRMGRYEEALQTFEEAVRLYRAVDDEEGEARSTAWIGELLGIQGLPHEGLARLRQLAASLQPRGASRGLVRLYMALSYLEADTGSYTAWLSMAERASEMARAVGDEPLLARAEISRAGALWFLGRHEDALDATENMIPVAEEQGDILLLCELLGLNGLVCVYRGELVRSRVYRERALAASRRVGDPAGEMSALSWLGSSYFLLGEWRQARAHMEEALAITRTLGAATVVDHTLWDLGHLCICEGDWETGSRYLHEALAMTEPTGNLIGLRLIQMYLANLDLLKGNPKAAVDRLTPLLDRPGFEELQVTPLLPLLAHAYLEMGDVGRADELVADAIRRTMAQHNRIDLIHTLLVKGKILGRQGAWQEAQSTFEDVLARARAMAFPHAEGLILYEYGLASVDHGEPAAARLHLGEGRGIFERLGARKDLERTDEALRSLA